MNQSDIKKINQITTNFYSVLSTEFSNSRNYYWQGWSKLLPILDIFFINKSLDNKIFKIADIGCGNLRFEDFLNKSFNFTFRIDAYDNNLSMQDKYMCNNIDLYELDIVNSLISNKFYLNNKNYDLICLFGFIHHVPSYSLRLKFIKILVEYMNKNSLLIISFWQFMNSKRIGKNAKLSNYKFFENYKDVNIEKNDFFLTWKNNFNLFRYCHHFSDKEINNIIDDIKKDYEIQIVKIFNEDGGDELLNKYVIIKKD